MGQRIKLSHPLIKTELSITQNDADPNVWALSARGHNEVTFNAGSVEEAMKVGPTLVGGLRRTEEAIAKSTERKGKRKAKKEADAASGQTAPKAQKGHK